MVIPAGLDKTTFTVATDPVSSNVLSTITASAGSASGYTKVSVRSMLLSLSSFLGGGTALGVVRLSVPGGTQGTPVSLITDNPNIRVPDTITVPAGSTSLSFPFYSSTVLDDILLTVTAGFGSIPQAKSSVTVGSPFGLSQSVQKGGQMVFGIIRLTTPAGPGGQIVNLDSSNAKVIVPGTVSIPAGASAVTFSVTTKVVSANTQVWITARFAGVAFSRGLLVVP